MNLASIIESHPADAVALVSRGQETTYGTLREQVAAIRGGLVGLGLVPGDRLAIIAGNNWYFVAAYLAGLGAGLVVVPLNPQAPAPELDFELTLHRSPGRGGHPRRRRRLRRARPRRAERPRVRDRDRRASSSPTPSCSTTSCPPSRPRWSSGTDDDLAVLMFTSGTVGSPRAAMLSHGNLLSNLEQMQSVATRAQGPNDVVFGLLPLFHIFGLNVVLDLSLLSGSRTVLIERFDPSSATEAIEKHEVTMMSGPPTMWSALASLPEVSPRRSAPCAARCRARPSSGPTWSRPCRPTWG